ncbi:MAG: flagellar biosynthetic protein FliP, partial [Deltaproteobacteria bacterium]|nr:flagellar biosynthetic protein FliP [Deltaproteobacteria bacterium]
MARVAAMVALGMIAALALAASAHAQTAAPAFPQIRVDVHEDGKPSDLSTPVKILLIVTVLALAPSILVMMTCFTRIVIVMGLLRQALGTHQVPSNQIVIGLGLFLTAFIMMPAFQQIYRDAYVPYTNAEIGYEAAADRAME